ncbi:MAG: sialidase family protein [Gammaproteobacteria bacterium]
MMIPSWLKLAGSLSLVLLFRVEAVSAETRAHPVVDNMATPAPTQSRQHHLSVAPDGRVILSWVEPQGDAKELLRFAMGDSGRWSAPQSVIAAKKLPDKPAVIGLAGGRLGAGWILPAEGSTDPDAVDIYLARSSDGGRTWSAPEKASRHPKAYPYDLFLSALADGTLSAVWSDGRQIIHHPEVPNKSKESWSGTQMLMATALDVQGRLGPEVPLDTDMCSCCMPHSVAADKEFLTVYRDHQAGEVRDIALVRWSGSGVSAPVKVHADGWVIEGCPSNGPAVDVRGSRVTVAWFTGANNRPAVKVAFSEDGGKSFGPPITVEGEAAAGFVDVLLLSDGVALVSWRTRRSDGPEQDLRIARVSESQGVLTQTLVPVGAFPDYPSEIPLLQRVGEQVFIAWTDATTHRVRLARLPVALEGDLRAQARWPL